MHYELIIISKNKIKNCTSLNINETVTLIDDCHLMYNNEEISFDYLIYSDIFLVLNQKLIGILTESKIPVTNFYKQTSVENIYFCKEDEIEETILGIYNS